jgi:hypothetical protein
MGGGIDSAGGNGMKPKSFNEACYQIAGELANLVIRKQHDYGHDNILAFGEQGLVVRSSDKVARLKNLLGKEGKAEPRIDAWSDLAGYAILALMLDRGWFELELEK